MKKFLVLIVFFCLVLSSSGFAQVPVPSQAADIYLGEKFQIITDLIDGDAGPYNFVTWNNYAIMLPNEKKYRSIATNEKIIFINLDDPDEIYEYGSASDWFYVEYGEQKPALRLEGENSIKFAEKKVKLIIENQPLDEGIIFLRRYPDSSTGAAAHIYVTPDITEYNIIINEGETDTFDLMLFIWTNDVIKNYIWLQKIDLTFTDEQEIIIDVDDAAKLETDAVDVIVNQLGLDAIGSSNFQLFAKDAWDGYVSMRGYYESYYEPSPFTMVENFLAYSGSTWFDDYHITQTFSTGFPKEEIAHITADYEYPFDVLEDYVSDQIKTLDFRFNEPFKTPKMDIISVNSYVSAMVDGEIRIFSVFPALQMAFEDYEGKDGNPEGVLYYRDITKCFTCNLAIIAAKIELPTGVYELPAVLFEQRFYNGKPYSYPISTTMEPEIGFFKNPVELDSQISEILFDPTKFPPCSDDLYCFQIVFKDGVNFPFGSRSMIDWFSPPPIFPPSYGTYTIESKDKFDNVYIWGNWWNAQIGDTITLPIAFLAEPDEMEPENLVSIKVTWHTIDLFEPDICLESRYGRIRTTGDEPVYAGWWAESKKTGIWDPINEECNFIPSDIPEENPPVNIGWSVAPLTDFPFGESNSYLIGAFVFVAVIVAAVLIYRFKKK